MSPVLAAAVIVLFEGLSFGLTIPVLAYFNKAYGGSPLMLGALFAMLSLPKVLTNPLFGSWSDRVGRRPVLLVNSLGTMAGSILWATAGGLWGLAASRLVTGLFSAQAGVAQSIAADCTPPERRAQAMAFLGAAFGIAFGLGPPLGGRVAEAWGHAAVGWCCAGLQAAAVLTTLLLLRETRAAPASGGAAPRPASPIHLAMRPQIAGLLVIVLLMTIGQAQLISTLALTAAQLYDFTERRAGEVFGLIGVLGILIQGGAIRPLTRALGEQRVALLGLALSAGGFGLLAAIPPTAGFWAGAGLLGVGVALAVPCLTALLSRAAGAQEQGASNGLQQAALGLGRASGNVSGGALMLLGVTPTYACAAALSVAAALLLVRRRGTP